MPKTPMNPMHPEDVAVRVVCAKLASGGMRDDDSEDAIIAKIFRFAKRYEEEFQKQYPTKSFVSQGR